MPNTFLNKAYEVNFNVNNETLADVNSYFESLGRASKRRKAVENKRKARRSKSDTSSGWRKDTSSGGGTAKGHGTHGGEEKECDCSLCVVEGRHRQAKTHTFANCCNTSKKTEANDIREDEGDD